MTNPSTSAILDSNDIKHFERALQRVFSLPTTRSTFRQLQNAILAVVKGNRDHATLLFETLLKGEVKEELVKYADQEAFQKLLDAFTVSAWVAKDVFEKGEFINIISSDIIQQQNRLLYANTLRRIDGEELQFLTDLESTLQLIQHFVQRLKESKERFDISAELFQKHRKELAALKNSLDEVLAK